MKRRIAFISEHASPLALLGGIDSGGQNVYVDQVARHLARMGFDVDIYTRREDPTIEKVVEYAPGVRVVHITAGPEKVLQKELLFQYMDEFAASMINFIEKNNLNYELIHAHFWMSGYVAAIVKYILNIPFVITFHALGKVRRIYQGDADGFPDVRFKVEEMIVKHADMIIAECPQDREDLMVLYYTEEEKIRIIPCGFEPSEFYPRDKKSSKIKLGLDPEEKIILQLGRMVPRKGIDNVVSALAYILKKKNIAVKLLIVGGESDDPDPVKTPELGRLKEIAEEEKIFDKIIFAGRKSREQLIDYYNAADVFVSTPWYEPFGITPLEAMACGTPVIGSNVGGIKFSVLHGKTGFLVPPKEPEILGERILNIIGNKQVMDGFCRNALEHVNKHFQWNTVTMQIAAMYSTVKKGKTDLTRKMQVAFFRIMDSFRIRSKRVPQLID